MVIIYVFWCWRFFGAKLVNYFIFGVKFWSANGGGLNKLINIMHHHHCFWSYSSGHLSGRAAAGSKPFAGHLSEYLASLSQTRSAHSLGNVIIIRFCNILISSYPHHVQVYNVDLAHGVTARGHPHARPERSTSHDHKQVNSKWRIVTFLWR